MQNFKELRVWEKAHQLTLSIYNASSKFPKEEIYSLTNQLGGHLHLYQRILPKVVVKIHKQIWQIF